MSAARIKELRNQTTMYIDGFGFSGFRSFGDEPQRIGPCRKVNLLVGQNNSGKSNVLTFLHKHFTGAVTKSAGRTDRDSISGLDRHLDAKHPFQFLIGVPTSGPSYQAYYDALVERHSSLSHHKHLFERILRSKSLSRGGEIAWFRYVEATNRQLGVDERLVRELHQERLLEDHQWHHLWGDTLNRQRGEVSVWITQLLDAFSPAKRDYPSIELIPAIRRVGDAGTEPSDHSGIGLIGRLAQLQNPTLPEQPKKQQFQDIVGFLRNVIDNESATLEIPHDRSTILVHLDGRTLPLSSLGTGVHEVVILAAAATILQQQILCIEEPELHLHPLLQRKLLRFLRDRTTNQYFITTHSAHILDLSDAAIFHVRHQSGGSTIDPAYTPTQRARICADLGYRASDLLQANSVIWVEGPSDRIYLNYWISAADEELIEGIHYSVMFYGGRLLSHLSANDPEVSDFVSLRRLNRYIAIVIDSDRATARTRLNDTKRRVIAEFEQGPGFAWVTKGREIENYIPPEVLLRAVKTVHPAAESLASSDQFGHALHFVPTGKRGVVDRVDKVKVAHEVVKLKPSADVLDLRSKIQKTVG